MHFQATTLLGLSALASARRFNAKDGGELAEKSRATAYRVNAHGEGVIECLEIGTLVPKKATSGSVSQLSLSDQDKLLGAEISSLAPGTELRFSEGESSALFSKQPKAVLVTVKSGLLEIQARGFGGIGGFDEKDDPFLDDIFSGSNGDDWFYFEDMSSYGHDDVDASFMATKKDDADLVLRTRSGDVTSLISFAFDEALESKKLHDGACKFAGVKTSPASSAYDSDDSGSKGFFRKQGL